MGKDIDDIFRQEFSGLVRQIRSRFGDGPPEPEDAVQTAFARYAEVGIDQTIGDPRGFLYTLARNRMIDGKRRHKTQSTNIQRMGDEDIAQKVEEITPERVVLGRDSLDTMNALINTLPSKQRTVLALSRLEGLTYAEIAAQTGYSLADISRQMKAALVTLSEGMADAFDGSDSRGGGA